MTEKQQKAILSKDKESDGKFFYASGDKKVFHNPSCPEHNLAFDDAMIFDSIEQAAKAGYRPCSHCRPELLAQNAKAAIAKKAQTYIEAHYNENYSVDDIANVLYINRHYLMRLFKEKTGKTLMEYQNFVRCMEANKLLRDSTLSIEIIAYTVGYATASHFAHVYKKIFQLTPSEYRKHLKRSV